jgi:hypothetical protein
MKKYRLLILFLLLLGSTGCKKWFDVTPKTEMKGSALFSNQAGFRDALIGVYALMTQANAYGTELTMAYADVLAQTYDYVRTSVGHSYQNAANYKYAEVGEQARQLRIWRQQYKAIANCNIIIEQADEKRALFSGKNFNIIKGEALALRAFLHFDLLRLYGESPVTGINKKAIPYVNAYTNLSFQQSTGTEVINQVINDLTAARELLKDADPYGPQRIDSSLSAMTIGSRAVRMNYYAATALMARVYLYSGDKANALSKAKEVIDSKLFPLFSNTAGQTQKEDFIFPVEQVFSLTIPDLKTRYADFFFPDVVYSGSTTSLTIRNTTLTDIFPAGLNTDYRLNWFEQANSSAMRISKYSYNTIIPLIKVSEMYLIAAESESSTIMAVNAYVNPLRVHRGVSELDGSATTQSQLNEEIRLQYRREFIGEGQLFYYYKRLNVQKLPTLATFTNSNEVYKLPIPNVEIDFGNIE